MISNIDLINKNGGNVRKTHIERIEIVDGLKKSLRTFFKGIGLNVTVSDFNNGDLRLVCKKTNLKGFDLLKLFETYGIKSNIVSESGNHITYVVYVFN